MTARPSPPGRSGPETQSGAAGRGAGGVGCGPVFLGAPEQLPSGGGAAGPVRCGALGSPSFACLLAKLLWIGGPLVRLFCQALVEGERAGPSDLRPGVLSSNALLAQQLKVCQAQHTIVERSMINNAGRNWETSRSPPGG